MSLTLGDRRANEAGAGRKNGASLQHRILVFKSILLPMPPRSKPETRRGVRPEDQGGATEVYARDAARYTGGNNATQLQMAAEATAILGLPVVRRRKVWAPHFFAATRLLASHPGTAARRPHPGTSQISGQISCTAGSAPGIGRPGLRFRAERCSIVGARVGWHRRVTCHAGAGHGGGCRLQRPSCDVRLWPGDAPESCCPGWRHLGVGGAVAVLWRRPADPHPTRLCQPGEVPAARGGRSAAGLRRRCASGSPLDWLQSLLRLSTSKRHYCCCCCCRSRHLMELLRCTPPPSPIPNPLLSHRAPHPRRQWPGAAAAGWGAGMWAACRVLRRLPARSQGTSQEVRGGSGAAP